MDARFPERLGDELRGAPRNSTFLLFPNNPYDAPAESSVTCKQSKPRINHELFFPYVSLHSNKMYFTVPSPSPPQSTKRLFLTKLEETAPAMHTLAPNSNPGE